MSAEVTAGFIAFLLAGMAATALGIRELFHQMRIVWRDVERLQDDAIRSGPNAGEVEALQEQLGALLKLRREVCEAIEINPNVTSHADVAFQVRAFVKTARAMAASESRQSQPAGMHLQGVAAGEEFEALYAMHQAICDVLGYGNWANPESVVDGVRNVERQRHSLPEFSPVPPPREKKPRRQRKPKTEQAPEAGQVSLETALAEAAEQQAADDANDFVAQGDAQ